jgi:hypothetical protein
MSYIITDCNAQLAEKGLTPCDSAEVSSNKPCLELQQQESFHQLCQGATTFRPIQSLVCRNSDTKQSIVFPADQIITACQEMSTKDPHWSLFQCYCCCADYDLHTFIVTPLGDMAVQLLDIGNPILAGSIDSGIPNWSSMDLVYSSGIPVTGENGLTIVFDNKQSLTVTTDHVFMRMNGKLMRAAYAFKGLKLMDANGKAVTVTAISKQTMDASVYNISALSTFDGSYDNHLVCSNGIISGDYTLQINFGNLNVSLVDELEN